MPEDPSGSTPRSRWPAGAALAALIVVIAVAGVVIAVLQRPPASPPVPPSPTVPRFPTFAPTPVPRGPVVGLGFSVADDPAAHELVVFGGIDSYATTWLWNGTRWSLARPPVSPQGRFGAAAAYDPATGTVMLYGGRLAPGEVENDTWTWDGRSWREVDTGTGGPPPGEGSLMAWDAATRQMVLVTPAQSNATGAATWIWQGNGWAQAPDGALPTGAFGSGLSFDPISNRLIFAGGIPPNGAGTSTWAWSGSGWHELRADIAAAAAGFAGLALDPSSNHLLLCGSNPGAPAAQLWSWSGVAWSPIRDSELPVPTVSATTDSDNGRFLVLGSLTAPNQGSPQPLEVWSWSGRAWQRLDGGAT